VRGTGALDNGFYYPLVISESGSANIAGPKITIYGGGLWSGWVRFGDTATPPGTRFTLEIIHSETEMSEGPLGERNLLDVTRLTGMLLVRR